MERSRRSPRLGALCPRRDEGSGSGPTWIVDDTGFLKQGTHSVGVQRQYTGSAGKITNCQIGVSLTVATEHSVLFKTKPELALDMIRRARRNRIPRGVVLADSAFGSSSDFRQGLRELGLHYAVGVDPQTTVFLLDPATGSPGARVHVRDAALDFQRCGLFRRCTWRKGTKSDLSARFAACRVVHAGRHNETSPREHEPLWLLIEWRDGEDEPAHYFLSSLPAGISRKQLVGITTQRWRTERVYEDLKGELGLDHFEGRRFPGWHHHVSVVLCCYAFIVAERARLFPPSTSRAPSGDQVHVAA